MYFLGPTPAAIRRIFVSIYYNMHSIISFFFNGAYLRKFQGRLNHEVQPLNILLVTIYDKKDTPFIYLLLTDGTAFAP